MNVRLGDVMGPGFRTTAAPVHMHHRESEFADRWCIERMHVRDRGIRNLMETLNDRNLSLRERTTDLTLACLCAESAVEWWREAWI